MNYHLIDINQISDNAKNQLDLQTCPNFDPLRFSVEGGMSQAILPINMVVGFLNLSRTVSGSVLDSIF